MKTIAIIDDDIHIGNMLAELLKKENYNILRAYSGTEALYLLSEKKPDLVLLDLMLPGLPEHIKSVLGMNVTRAKDPMDCVALGINRILYGGSEMRRFICSRSK